MLIVRDSKVKKLFYKEQEIDKILDWNGNVVFVKESAPTMTNTIKFHTTSAVTDSYRFSVTYTDSTSDEMRYSEPNKQYVFTIPTDKIVKTIGSTRELVDEIIVSCKINLSDNLFTENPKTIRLISCDATSNTSLSNALRNMAYDSTLVEIRNLDARNATSAYELFGTKVESFVLNDLNLSKVTDMSYMFSNCSATTIDISNWDTSSVNSLNHTFTDCTKVTSLDLSSWDTSNVTDISYMCNACYELQSLDVSSWNTSNVTTMKAMFQYCEKLKSLDLSSWDTSNMTVMRGAFIACKGLQSLDLSSWDTSKVTDMYYMFIFCENLQYLNLSSWDTSKVTDMDSMFQFCKNLESLDLSSWDMTKVTNRDSMFSYCNKLNTIYMRGCNQTTIDKIKAQLKRDGILNQVTIVTE